MTKEKQTAPKKSKTVFIEKTNAKTGKVTRIEYAKVTDRLSEFHKSNPDGMIKTDSEFRGDYVIFKSVIIPDVNKSERYFTGTSMGKIGAEKALEKLETLAVGRALAFAGYLATGEIASAEEMQRMDEQVIQLDVENAFEKLSSAKTLDELKTAWFSLSADERASKEIETYKETLKAEMTNPKTDEGL